SAQEENDVTGSCFPVPLEDVNRYIDFSAPSSTMLYRDVQWDMEDINNDGFPDKISFFQTGYGEDTNSTGVVNFYDIVLTDDLNFTKEDFCKDLIMSHCGQYIFDPSSTDASAYYIIQLEPIIEIESLGIDNSISRCNSKTISVDPESQGFSPNIYNWRYSYNGITWLDLPIQYQGLEIINLQSDVFGAYTGNVFIRVEHCGGYSDTITLNVIDCSPQLTGNPSPIDTKCSYSDDGSFTAQFERGLNSGERMLVYVEREVSSGVWDAETSYIVPDDLSMSGSTLTWPEELAAGTYRLRWVTKYGTAPDANPNSDEMSNPFTIGSPPLLEVGNVSPSQPVCPGDTGS